MHQQLRTSPSDTGDNMRRVLDALAGINIEGIGPEFDSTHVRTAVEHPAWEAAWAALKSAGLEPVACKAVLVTLPNSEGKLRQAVENLARRGYVVESVLVLASPGQSGLVRVSIGVRDGIKENWEQVSESLAEEIMSNGPTS
jgi:hypothetical protein